MKEKQNIYKKNLLTNWYNIREVEKISHPHHTQYKNVKQ